MSKGLTALDHPSDRAVRFTRLLDAPRELVWEMWSDPRHLHEWYGPKGFKTTTHAFDFRVGGEWLHTMHTPDGRDNPNRIVFREITAPSRLVYENGWDLPDAPLDFRVEVTLTPEGTQTRLTFVMTFADASALKTASEVYGVLQGGIETFDKIAAHVAGRRRPAPDTSDREIVTVRIIKAPRQVVWDAWTIPDQWKHWWGPDGFTNTIEVMDVRSGGAWRFTMHGPDGTDYRNESSYLEVIRPSFLSFVHHSTPKFTSATTFEEVDGGTKVTMRATLASPEHFKMAVEVFHAVEGGRQTLARLAAQVEP